MLVHLEGYTKGLGICCVCGELLMASTLEGEGGECNTLAHFRPAIIVLLAHVACVACEVVDGGFHTTMKSLGGHLKILIT